MSKLFGKHILVTGSDGFLGRHVMKKLLERGIQKEHISTTHFPAQDLRRYVDCMEAVKGSDVVIHLAGTVGGIEFTRTHPGTIFYDNAASALHMLEASRRAGIKKFVGIGSVCEYPLQTQTPFQEEHIWDGYPEPTNGPYGLAKRFMLEQSQAYWAEYGLHAVHLLLTNLYGPGDNTDPVNSHVIPALIGKTRDAKEKKEHAIEVWGNAHVTREFLYVEDAAEAVVLAAERYDKPEPVNVGSGQEISIGELALMIGRLMDFHGELKWNASKPAGQPKRLVNIEKAKRDFGFEAKVDLEQGLKNTIQWMQENAA